MFLMLQTITQRLERNCENHGWERKLAVWAHVPVIPWCQDCFLPHGGLAVGEVV